MDRRPLAMFALVVAGEAIFFLPFVLPRVFRPTVLQVFGITNWQLGLAFSAYGLVAMLAYLPGGPLADRFPARTLMVISLLATALGGVWLAAGVEPASLTWLYACWGLTTILLFWSALIRATRLWGGHALPGTAFGLLDGGRGLVAASIGTGAVYLFAALMPERLAGGESGALLRHVIWLFTTVTALAAALVWWAVPYTPPSATGNEGFRLGECRRVLALPQVWLQALVVICAYVAYKGLDDVSLYAREIMGMSEVDAARMATVALWMRPPAAVVAGLVADRWSAITSTRVCFALVALGSFGIASGLIDSAMVPLFYLVILGTCVAVFALRALYFAIMEEGQVPLRYTGTAVGIVSAIGYLPDVFMGPAMGWLLDHHPGMAGHSRVFLLIGIFSLLGWAASLGFALCVRQNHGITAV